MKIKVIDLPKGHTKFVHKPTRVTFYKVHRQGTIKPVEGRYSMGDPLVLRIGDVVVVDSAVVPPEFQPLTKNRFAEVLPEDEQTVTENPESAPEPEPEPEPASEPEPEPEPTSSSKSVEPIV